MDQIKQYLKKKYSSNKKIGCCVMFVFVSLFIFWGCKKLAIKTGPTLAKNWAKEWYYGEFKKTPAFSSSKINHYPDWAHSMPQYLGEYTIVEYPLKSSVRTSPISYADYTKDEKKRIMDASFERVIVGMKSNQKPQIRVLTYVPELEYLKRNRYDASNNKITAIANDFDGLVLVSDWNGKFITGFNFKNGKITTRVRLNQNKKNETIDKKLAVTSTNKSASEEKSTNDLQKQVNSCYLIWTDNYVEYSSGHYDGDNYIEDDRYLEYKGSSDFQLIGDCGDALPNDPIDPCELFPCGNNDNSSGTQPPDLPCPTGQQAQLDLALFPFPSLDISSLSNFWGLTLAENIEVEFDVCNDGQNWHAILTKIIGNYSLQTQLVPGCSEVTGPSGNTTAFNYCSQMLDMYNESANNSNGFVSWYMLSAVTAHENVHKNHLIPALGSASSLISFGINQLSVPNIGQGSIIAKSQIEGMTAFNQAISIGFTLWSSSYITLCANDHSGPTAQAERTVVNPMITQICNYSRAASWSSCSPVCN
ncbi:MAG: hypothetical protein V4450_17915 [Bacteroidota bacterium]